MLLFLILLSGVSTPSSSAPRSVKTFAVYALSRGRGVPPAAREALRKVRALVEKDQKRGIGVTMETTRIGIEGETRMCIDYKKAAEGRRAYDRARAIVKGIDLVNLVAEPCAKNEKQEEKP